MSRLGVSAILLIMLATGAFPQSATGLSDLHVTKIGSGSPKIIVLHGGPGLRHNYLRPEWDMLSDLGTVVYYDQRGCGLSTHLGPHTWKQHVEDLRYVVERTSPEDPVILAGSSWGSLLALLFARTYPEQVTALVLSGLSSWMEPSERQALFASLPEEDQQMYETLGSGPISSDLVEDSVSLANSDRFHPLLAPRIGISCTGAGRATSISLRDGIASDELRTVHQRTLIVTGPLMLPYDRTGAETIAHLLPNAEVVEIRDTGRNPWVERPAEFFGAIRRFLTRERQEE